MSDPPNANGEHIVATTQAPFDLVPRWLRELGPYPYLAYAALVSYEGERGCFPSHAALADRAMMSPARARAALHELERAGAISITQRTRDDGGQSSNSYVLLAHTRGSLPHGTPPPGGTPPRHDVAPHMNENQVEREDEVLRTSSREPERADVDRICCALAEHVQTTVNIEPIVTVAWRRDARLMLDRDRAPLAEVLALIEWLGTADSDAQFWSVNVLSVGKLRKQYGRLQAVRLRGGRANGNGHVHVDHVVAARDLAARLEAQGR